MSVTWSGSGHEHDLPTPSAVGLKDEADADDRAPGGPGPPGITRDGAARLRAGVRCRAGTGRAPGSVLIAVAAWLLALTGGGALFASFSAQYAYIHAVRHQDAASVIEALLPDLLMSCSPCWRSACPGRASPPGPSGPSSSCARPRRRI